MARIVNTVSDTPAAAGPDTVLNPVTRTRSAPTGGVPTDTARAAPRSPRASSSAIHPAPNQHGDATGRPRHDRAAPAVQSKHFGS